MRPFSPTRARTAAAWRAQSKANKQQLECNFKHQLRVERNNGYAGEKYVVETESERFHFRFHLIIIVTMNVSR